KRKKQKKENKKKKKKKKQKKQKKTKKYKKIQKNKKSKKQKKTKKFGAPTPHGVLNRSMRLYGSRSQQSASPGGEEPAQPGSVLPRRRKADIFYTFSFFPKMKRQRGIFLNAIDQRMIFFKVDRQSKILAGSVADPTAQKRKQFLSFFSSPFLCFSQRKSQRKLLF
ncbi:MAG: hypothetical protein BJ554DRAFT_3024, partial [Olpidium bornovanus]